MCGICGIVSQSPISSTALKQMASAISHRGPDDDGFHIGNGIGLGHRRLSIIDLHGGRQPISNEDETVWIVFNGEIYNFKQLRTKLLQQGHIFKTKTDTEVILHLYEEHHERCVDHLNGMFAFAIYDEPRKQLFLARDRIGQKPLFYSMDGTNFLFASEAKSILAHGSIKSRIETEAVHHYLTLRFIPPPFTMFKGIQKLPAGHYLTFKNKKVDIHRYWDLNFTNKLEMAEIDYIENLREKLLATIESHLVSDVPVGAFLSGGMDTSMVVAMMGKTAQTSFKTFAIGVAEQDYNELPYARKVSEMYDTEHHERVVCSDLIHMTPKIIYHLDEPSDPIAACMLQAAKLASEHVKVVLGGDGGDELFAGFDRYMGMRLIDRYKFIPSFFRNFLISPVVNNIPDSFTYKSTAQKFRWLDYLSQFDNGERYAEATSFFRFGHTDKEKLFAPAIWQELQDNRSTRFIIEKYNRENAVNPIDKMLYADFMTRLAEHTLMLTDRLNMAYGLEARSPFLDHTLVELMAKFPSNLKIKGRELKYILRTLGRSYLPVDICKREKQGFMFPVAYWFRQNLYNFLKNMFADARIVSDQIVRKDEVFRLIEEHRQSRIDNHVRIWMLFNLEIWYRINIQNETLDNINEFLNQKMPNSSYTSKAIC